MPKQKSIQRLPVEVDPFRLVEQGRIYKGRIPLSDYPRLKEQLFVSQSDGALPNIEEEELQLVNVSLEFTRTDTRLPVVLGKISTVLKMPCQRCLEAETFPFETELKVVFVANDEQAMRIQEGYDTWLVEEQRLFLKDFIEDEILLAMPLVVTHKACESKKELIEALPEETSSDNELEVEEKNNPFAILKDLKT